MKVFITGATGFIGLNVARALRRAGHEVWGLVRSDAKARAVARDEIHPVIGTMQAPESYREAAGRCSVLIHAAVDYEADSFALDMQTVEALIAAAASGPRPKTLIYTSGVWVYGTTGDDPADETKPLSPPALVARRPAVEQMVLSAPGVRGLVARPGCVYGLRGGLTGTWFHGAHREKTIHIVGDGANRWTMVHADDVADGYVRLAGSGLAGEVFNFTDRSRFTVREMAEAAARAAGFAGAITCVPLAEASKTMGGFAECLALDQHVDSRKAVRLLGWQPKHGGFADEAGTFFLAWKASQEA